MLKDMISKIKFFNWKKESRNKYIYEFYTSSRYVLKSYANIWTKNIY